MEDLDSLIKAGRQRLYPQITNPNWLVLRKRRRIFLGWLKQLGMCAPRVLDVGGHLQPYRELLPKPHEYWSVDLRPGTLANVVADATRLPFAENSFDLVFCTQMLEYAPQPATVVNEIRRVLRLGGVLILSAPSIFPRDSEQDAWRFFPAALNSLCVDFAATEIVPECGSTAGFLRTTAVYVHASARYQPLQMVLRISLIPTLNLLGFITDKITGAADGSFTVNYSVRARK